MTQIQAQTTSTPLKFLIEAGRELVKEGVYLNLKHVAREMVYAFTKFTSDGELLVVVLKSGTLYILKTSDGKYQVEYSPFILKHAQEMRFILK